MAGWALAGDIGPFFLEVVGSKGRASIFAWQCSLEGLISTLLGAPFVGFLAEHYFRYHPTKESVASMSAELRQQNFEALQLSLAVMTTVPWILCFAAISCLHYSYLYDGTGVSKGNAELQDKRPGPSDNYSSTVDQVGCHGMAGPSPDR